MGSLFVRRRGGRCSITRPILIILPLTTLSEVFLNHEADEHDASIREKGAKGIENPFCH